MKSIALRQWEAAAYAAGRLTQLRRVCRPQPKYGASWITCNGIQQDWLLRDRHGDDIDAPLNPPYGAPGDRLALREMFSYYERGSFKTPNGIWYWADGEVPGSDWSIPKSSTQMPLWAVRWHPVIMAVRLERNNIGVWEWVIDVEGGKA